ncbi:MAG: hypothetical protein HYZ72_01100 [Deltaproteobacteria bacterium]|nr:hypothetical protein [Deltaproteobacteria bacterium]
MPAKEWPQCQSCHKGVLLPLSDYGPQGNDITFKLWVCHNPACGFSLRIDKGQVSFGRPVRPKTESWESRR